jgi:hypothetical protein
MVGSDGACLTRGYGQALSQQRRVVEDILTASLGPEDTDCLTVPTVISGNQGVLGCVAGVCFWEDSLLPREKQKAGGGVGRETGVQVAEGKAGQVVTRSNRGPGEGAVK